MIKRMEIGFLVALIQLPMLGWAEAQPSMKGTEVWSWRDETSRIVYGVLPGTNRIKSPEEVHAAAVGGLAELKKRLDQLPAGESIIVMGLSTIKGYTCPPDEEFDEIRALTDKLKFILISSCYYPGTGRLTIDGGEQKTEK